MWVQSLGQEDPLEKIGHGNPLQHSYLENFMGRGDTGYSPQDHKESDTTEVT